MRNSAANSGVQVSGTQKIHGPQTSSAQALAVAYEFVVGAVDGFHSNSLLMDARACVVSFTIPQTSCGC